MYRGYHCDSMHLTMFDAIPNDVRCIIYRYLFDCTYNNVKRQYVELWLNDIIWSTLRQKFMVPGRDFNIANWRSLSVMCYGPVYTLYKHKPMTMSKYSKYCLPKNYYYSIGDMKQFILSLHGVL